MLTLDLLFTIAACSCLLVLWLASAAVLPWTESELEEVYQQLVRESGLDFERLAEEVE